MLDSFNTSGQAQQVVKVWSQYMLPLMSTFEPLFHVVMAIIFAGYDQTLRKRNATVSRQVYLQKHKAISKLRARLSQADAVPDDGVILTMLYLSVSLSRNWPFIMPFTLTSLSAASGQRLG